MVYERHVFYLEYWKKASRIGTFGYVMVWHKDLEYGMKIAVDGLHKKYDGQFQCLAVEEKNREIASLVISMGRGSVDISPLNRENVCGTGYSLNEIYEILIPLGDDDRLVCHLWNDKDRPAISISNKTVESPQREEAVMIQVEEDSVMAESEQEETSRDDVKIEDERLPEEKQGEKKSEVTFEGKERNKWEQLETVYSHIRPFRDEREYLSIGLGDFLVFSEASYGLVYNSFLLHGFYNYHHLILHREVRGKCEKYYVGVPGIYHEKERRAAVMYGFEGFESSNVGIISQGDFGYYMIQTRL